MQKYCMKLRDGSGVSFETPEPSPSFKKRLYGRIHRAFTNLYPAILLSISVFDGFFLIGFLDQ